MSGDRINADCEANSLSTMTNAAATPDGLP
jgi:hypothetical protein